MAGKNDMIRYAVAERAVILICVDQKRLNEISVFYQYIIHYTSVYFTDIAVLYLFYITVTF